MAVQICICDDREEDIENLETALRKYDPSFQIFLYADGKSLLESLAEQKNEFDILFLDIYMPGLNGIETARQIRKVMKDTIIVFVSSSNEHYPETFDVFALHYLLKPLDPQKLHSVLDQALTKISRENRQQISFSYKGTTHQIFCRNILYIESKDKIIYFHMADRTALSCYTKLDGILAQLPEDDFIRCHQSFAVNVFHVTEMDENRFWIGATAVSISKKFQRTAKDKYFSYLFNHMNSGYRDEKSK